MDRFVTGLLGGLTVGLLIGAGSMTSEKQRRQMKREGKRVIKKAGNYIDDMVR